MADTAPAWAQRLIAAHTAVTDAVSHSVRLGSDRYFVWQEDGANDLLASDRHAERTVTGSTDLYTKQEFDPWGPALEESLDAAGIAWSRIVVEYEEDTETYHWSWDWEVW